MSFLLTLCKLEIDIFTEDIHFLTRQEPKSKATSRKSNFNKTVKENLKATTRFDNLF